ncbi:MAG: glutaminase [Calditrichaeota bacterium]|nr:glutaminase [Calditrichota bacterium]
MNYTELLESIYSQISLHKNDGKIASYIPELAQVNPDQFGIAIRDINGETGQFGDAEVRFSIQSISKVIALVLAVHKAGDKVWERVRVESSGNAFNSLVQLEYENGIPRNPLINSGAIVICDILLSHCDSALDEMLELIRVLSGNTTIHINPDVVKSELDTGYRNFALAYFLKSMNNLNNDVESVLQLYCSLCAIEMSCVELAHCFHFFATHNIKNETGKLISKSQIKRISAIMLSCGFYDESGEFLFKVGLPRKSGVGGGIVAIHPRHFSVAAWSPRLNAKGNSVMAMKALELLTTELDTSLF